MTFSSTRFSEIRPLREPPDYLRTWIQRCLLYISLEATEWFTALRRQRGCRSSSQFVKQNKFIEEGIIWTCLITFYRNNQFSATVINNLLLLLLLFSNGLKLCFLKVLLFGEENDFNIEVFFFSALVKSIKTLKPGWMRKTHRKYSKYSAFEKSAWNEGNGALYTEVLIDAVLI